MIKKKQKNKTPAATVKKGSDAKGLMGKQPNHKSTTLKLTIQI